MHELPVTQALLAVALEKAKAANATRITDIYVEIGQLSSYVDDSVQFYWDTISAGTAAQGAKLHFERIPLVLRCERCDEEFQPDGRTYTCPRCGKGDVSVVRGDELRMVGLDVERAGVEEKQ